MSSNPRPQFQQANLGLLMFLYSIVSPSASCRLPKQRAGRASKHIRLSKKNLASTERTLESTVRYLGIFCSMTRRQAAHCAPTASVHSFVAADVLPPAAVTFAHQWLGDDVIGERAVMAHDKQVRPVESLADAKVRMALSI